MDSLIVHLIQLTMILCLWKYIGDVHSDFAITAPMTLDMMIARFVASMMMHINVERDVRAGLMMMKFAVNHHDHFTNVYPAFTIAFLLTLLALITELNVMIILTSMQDILGIILKFVSLTCIATIPKSYYDSLVQHKLLISGGYKLKITKFRKDYPLERASGGVICLRLTQKMMRIFYCSTTFYFMPFAAIFLNFNFMISNHPRPSN